MHRYFHRDKETNLALILVPVCGNIGPARPLYAMLRTGLDTQAPWAQAMTLYQKRGGCVCTRQTNMKVCWRKPSSFAVPTAISLTPTLPGPWAPGPTQAW